MMAASLSGTAAVEVRRGNVVAGVRRTLHGLCEDRRHEQRHPVRSLVQAGHEGLERMNAFFIVPCG